MALTRADKEDIQEMLTTAISHIKEVQSEVMKGVNGSLTRIEEQTTKTNGRVTALEKQLPHTISNCPHTNIINELRDSSVENKGVKSWKMATMAIGAAFLGALVAVIAVFEFIMKYKP